MTDSLPSNQCACEPGTCQKDDLPMFIACKQEIKTQLTLEGDGVTGGELYFERAYDSFAVNLNGQLMFLSVKNAARLRDYLSARISPEPKPESSKELLAEALNFVRILREHDPSRAKHPRQDYILALAGEIERLQRERDEIYRANVGLAMRAAHEPSATPVASRKLIDDPYELRPRYTYRDGEVQGWELLYARPAVPPPVTPMERALQLIMVRLTDLLDEDQFNNIEAIARDAGVRYPDECPPGACHASVQHDGSFGMVICGVCKMPIPAVTKSGSEA